MKVALKLTNILQFQGTIASLSDEFKAKSYFFERAKKTNFVMLPCSSRTRQSKYKAEIVSGGQLYTNSVLACPPENPGEYDGKCRQIKMSVFRKDPPHIKHEGE